MKSFPFDSEVTFDSYGMPLYDRGADSQELQAFYHLLYKDGVFPNPSTGLQVTEYDEEMSVLVLPGNVVIQGAIGREENERILVFEASGSIYDRIDSVVARLNNNYEYRKIDLYVVKGMEAANPVAPELTRLGGIYELRLANVFIAKNTTTVSAERITDTRLNTEDCGIVTCNPNKVDTTSLFNQYQAALNHFLGYVEGCIDGTEAGELRKQISDLGDRVGDKDISGIGDGTVTGAISELNTGLTVRYNPESDYIQLYNGTKWMDYKLAGLLFDGYLFHNGTYQKITGFDVTTEGRNASCTFGTSIDLKSYINPDGNDGSKTVTGKVTIQSKEFVDLKEYDRITVKATCSVTRASSYGTVYLQVGTLSTSKTFSNTTAGTLEMDLDIASLKDEYKIIFDLPYPSSGSNWKANNYAYFNIESIKLTSNP